MIHDRTITAIVGASHARGRTVEHPIQEVARLAGVTSRALRHYDAVGLLAPSRTDRGGRRFYDGPALVRLQRILLLRGLGLGIPAIAEVLAGDAEDVEARERHVAQLRRERRRLDAQIASVTTTIDALSRGEVPMAEQMFEGFDHSRYEQEVRERWGDAAWQRGDDWWKRLGEDERRQFGEQHLRIQDDYDAAIAAGESAAGETAQRIAARHVDWIAIGWQGRRPEAGAIRSLADMYVADPRFAANYTRAHAHGAEFVRDALHVYADGLG